MYIIFVFLTSCSKDHNSGTIIRIKENEKWGFINSKVEIKIKPIFDYVDDFESGIAKVEINYRFGLIDMNGKFIVDPLYDEIYILETGIAIVNINNHWGFINNNGKFLLKPIEADIIYNDENCILVRTITGNYYLKNDTLIQIHEDISFIYEVNDTILIGKYFFPGDSDMKEKAFLINKRNGERISKIYYNLEFNDPLLEFSLGEKLEYNYLYGLMDLNERIIYKPEFQEISELYDDLRLFWDKKNYGYFDKNYQVKIPAMFDYAEDFNEGYAIIGKRKEGNKVYYQDRAYLYGVIDKTGKIILDYKYDYISYFENGVAIVGFDKPGDYYEAKTDTIPNLLWTTFGLINIKGEYIIPPVYSSIYRRSRIYLTEPWIKANGKLVLLQKDKKYGMIDIYGNEFLPFEYDYLI